MNLPLVLTICGLIAMAIYVAMLKRRVTGYAFNERNMIDALNYVDAAIFIKDRHGQIIYANTAASRLKRIEEAGFDGSENNQSKINAGISYFSDTDKRVIESGERTKEEAVIWVDDKELVYLESKYPLIDKRGNIVGVVGISTDITELYHLRRESELAARTDELTGLYNRRAFFEFADAFLANARRYGRPLSMLIVDLDHFKQINDRYGHPVGDRVLEDVAAKMSLSIRDVDRLARIGGEEFAVLLPETNLDRAIEVAERIRSCFQPIQLQGSGSVSPTVSIGAGTLHAEDQSIHSLYQRVDAALYRAKSDGRNRIASE